MRRAFLTAGLALAAIAAAWSAPAGLPAINLDDPAIQYNTRTPHDAVSYFGLRIQRGQVHLKYEPPQGYLRWLGDDAARNALYANRARLKSGTLLWPGVSVAVQTPI